MRIISLILVLSICRLPVLSQQTAWPPVAWRDSSIHYMERTSHGHTIMVGVNRRLPGYMILKNGDSLSGYIGIGAGTTAPRYTMLEKGADKGRYILVRDIRRVVVETPSGQTITLESLHNWAIAKLVARKGDAAIYSSGALRAGFPDGGAQLLLITKGRLRFIYRNALVFNENDFEPTHRGEQIVRFINRRYGFNFKPSDFKDISAMLDLILEKEANRGNSPDDTTSSQSQ
ncbi:MAG TPA: hypothetical protein VIM64_19050 [Puia sp.]